MSVSMLSPPLPHRALPILAVEAVAAEAATKAEAEFGRAEEVEGGRAEAEAEALAAAATGVLVDADKGEENHAERCALLEAASAGDGSSLEGWDGVPASDDEKAS
jgi:hypothetical protein